MVEQVHARQKTNTTSLKDSEITFIPGIFDDNVEKSEHPNLPKSWLSTPVARLLAAHMKAVRRFKNDASKSSNPNNHIFVCMEDDIVLHKNFETIVRDSAKYCQLQNTPTCISLGYVIIPAETQEVEKLSNGIKLKKITAGVGGRGTQCYMMNYAYVSKVLDEYESEYKRTKEPIQGNNIASDHFMFNVPDTQHLIVEPPAAIEDFPTFGTMLNHDWNKDLYNRMIQEYPRNDYYIFVNTTVK